MQEDMFGKMVRCCRFKNMEIGPARRKTLNPGNNYQ